MNRQLTREEIEALDAPELFKYIALMPGYGVWEQEFKGCVEPKPLISINCMTFIKGRSTKQGEFKQGE